MDKTRIATCMLNNDLSQMNFKFIEGVRGVCIGSAGLQACACISDPVIV